MRTSEKPSIDVGVEVAQGIYANAKFETREVQPIYLLHRDTVRTFLHEKISVFSQQGRLLGLAGVEVSLVAALFTATFNDWHGIHGSLIEACFFVCSVIFGIWCIVELVRWLKVRSSLNVDALTNDLGKRGSVIQPDTKGAVG